MEKISNEQWTEIEETLKHQYGRIEFTHGEREIVVARVPTNEGKSNIVVFIDGNMNFSWGRPPIEGMFDNADFKPEIIPYWRKRSKALYSAKDKKEVIGLWGKRRAYKKYPDLDNRYEWYDPMFTTAKSLVSQFKKLEGLQLVPKEEFVEGGA